MTTNELTCANNDQRIATQDIRVSPVPFARNVNSPRRLQRRGVVTACTTGIVHERTALSLP